MLGVCATLTYGTTATTTNLTQKKKLGKYAVQSLHTFIVKTLQAEFRCKQNVEDAGLKLKIIKETQKQNKIMKPTVSAATTQFKETSQQKSRKQYE